MAKVFLSFKIFQVTQFIKRSPHHSPPLISFFTCSSIDF